MSDVSKMQQVKSAMGLNNDEAVGAKFPRVRRNLGDSQYLRCCSNRFHENVFGLANFNTHWLKTASRFGKTSLDI